MNMTQEWRSTSLMLGCEVKKGGRGGGEIIDLSISLM